MKLNQLLVNAILALTLVPLVIIVMSCGDDDEEVIQPDLRDTHRLSATIPVGEVPFDIAVAPDGKLVYLTNGKDNTVSIISTASLSVVKAVQVDKYPGGLAISPDGNFVYVGHFDASTLAVISTASQEVVEMAEIGEDIEGMMAISPDGATIYASDFAGGGEINIISAASRQIVGSIDVDPSMDVAIAPDGSSLYVVNSSDEELVQISTATHQVTNHIPLGQDVHDYTNLAIEPNGDFVYVPIRNLMIVVSTASEAVVQSITVGNASLGNFALTGVAVSPDGEFVYLANAEESSVAIISTETSSVIETVSVGRGPVSIAVSPDGRAIYVTTVQDNSVSVIVRE